jgi:ABC-2 type transport system permease protein
VSRLVGLYGAKFRTEIALQLAYRGALVIWLIGIVLEPIVSLVVWTTVANGQGGAVGGFTAGEFAAYFTILMIVNQLTVTWHFWFFEWRVRNGYFSPLLLLPVHPIHSDIAENLTFKMLTATIVVPVAIFLVVAFGATFHTQPWHVAAFVPALLLAMALRFVLEWTLGAAAFWITRTGAFNQAYTVVMLFLSGFIAPLALFPATIQTVAALLPFRWMVAFPVEVALGRLAPGAVVLGFAAQAAWIAVVLVVMRIVWAAGTRRYSAVGA